MSKAIIGIADNVTQVEAIVGRLQSEAAVAVDNISVLVPDTGDTRDIGHVKATKAPEGATTGAAVGGLTGGTIGLLAGLGTLAIPGLGAFIAAGPIMGALGGLGAGAATGGVVGGLIGLGIPEYEAKVYEDSLKEGKYLVAVHDISGDQAKKARKILEDENAAHISKVSESDAD